MATATKIDPNLQTRVTEIAKAMDVDPWKKNLTLAMDFVLTGAVDLGASTVKSGAHKYQVDTEYGCSCVDSKVRSKYCKHYVAYEMQRRLEEGDMPNTTPQDQWEAKMQSGEEVNDLFGEPEENPDAALDEVEPDDIPEPQVPEQVKQVAAATFAPDSLIRTEGFQYTDYPSTLCIKRHIGQTELMWTFRGGNDEEVWGRVARMVGVLDKAAQRYTPPPPPQQAQAAAQQAPPPPAPEQPSGDKAVNHGRQPDSPYCPVHSNPDAQQYVFFDLWEKGNRRWYAHKAPDGTFCNAKR